MAEYRSTTLHAWTLENAYGSSDVVRAVRNPYYWKVDTAGNQLPYLDSIEWQQVEDPENILLKAISGEIDFQSRHITGSSFRSILFENQERGNYRLASLADTQASLASLLFNLNIEDEFKRGVFQDINFRKGISHAVNREEIVELVYLGNGGPSQVAPTVNSVFYDESINNNAIEYNVKLANEYLDKAGLTNRDSRGFRTGLMVNHLILPLW
ncbi:oligopeptide ABC transporter [Vibrio variabilis]|uniref:Oligopeptide ABC transporter n=1 Tax=Vibrio variabilis TaxID=990271 RepID=A0ABQ0JG46_9VIBR|nr:oligopeptide ABC transporter [Vibrio variabilis]